MKLPVRVKQCAAKAYQCGKSLEPTRTDTRLGSVCVFPERDSKQSEWSGLENVSLVGRVSVTSADVKLRQGLEGEFALSECDKKSERSCLCESDGVSTERGTSAERSWSSDSACEQSEWKSVAVWTWKREVLRSWGCDFR